VADTASTDRQAVDRRRIALIEPGSADPPRRHQGEGAHGSCQYTGKEGQTSRQRRGDGVLHGLRATLGPPWSKDHRMALAATILAG
jgi:hypothetical protein